MSVESAVAYIRRMRSDDAFRVSMNEVSDDDDAAWNRVRTAGYEFTISEFKEAQDVIYKEYGITPM